MKTMLKRIIVGVILIALTGVLLCLDWWMEQATLPGPVKALPLAVLIALLISAGYVELSRLSVGAGLPMLGVSGMVCAVAVATLPFWRQGLASSLCARALMQVTLGGVVMVLFVGQVIRYRTAGAVRRIGATLLAVCYLGVCGAVVLSIRMVFGLKAFVLFLLVVKSADIGAYFVGSAVGRHKMIPWLSPGKSWEGLIGGLVFSAAVAAGFVAAAGWLGGGEEAGRQIGLLGAAGFAVVVGLFGQAGDLCESALKRDAGLKDAGTSAGPFGGVLDVVDSPLLAAPAAFVMLAMLQ